MDGKKMEGKRNRASSSSKCVEKKGAEAKVSRVSQALGRHEVKDTKAKAKAKGTKRKAAKQEEEDDFLEGEESSTSHGEGQDDDDVEETWMKKMGEIGKTSPRGAVVQHTWINDDDNN